MADQRALTALSRIEGAFERIETALARDSTGEAERSDAISQRHESLRSAVRSAVDELDRLIEARAN